MFEILKTVRGKVHQIYVLGMAPNPFHRIELRSVRRKPLDNNPSILFKPGFHLLGPMNLSTIPDERKPVR